MAKIKSKSREQLIEKAQCFFDESRIVQEPTVVYRHDYATETYTNSEKYPFMESYNAEKLASRILAREEEYARTGCSIDFQDMMADFKNEFKW